MVNKEASMKLLKAKINSQRDQPFFYYLVMNLKLKEVTNIETAGVSANGDFYYNPNFINQLDNKQVFAVLSHEVGHLVFEHFKFKMDNKEIANVAMDIAINYLLEKNNIKLPHNFTYFNEQGVKETGHILIPDYSNKVKLNNGDYIVEKIDEKNSNQLYDELMKNLPKQKMAGLDSFDDHSKMSKGKKGKTGKDSKNGKGVVSKKDMGDISKEWKQKISEAVIYAKMKGNLSDSLQKFTDMILDKSMNWKMLFKSFLQKNQPSGYNWNKPNKRFRPLGIYMPRKFKENVEFVTAIDTSGSISNEDFNDFANELLGMINGHKNVKGKVLQWDTKVETEFEVTKQTTAEDLKGKGRCGYGGTNVSCVKPYCKDKDINPKLLVILTDGYWDKVTDSELPDCKVIWLLTKDGTEENIPKGHTIIRIN